MHFVPICFAATRRRSRFKAGDSTRNVERGSGPSGATDQTSLAAQLRTLAPWAMLFIAALAVRLVYMWGQARNNPLFDYPIMDSAKHDLWARKIVSGEGLGPQPFFRAPLYYYFLAGLYGLFTASTLVGSVAGCIIGAVNAVLIGRLGELLAGKRIGWTAGIAAVFYWPLIYYDPELLSVSLEILLNLLTLWFLLTGAARASYARWGLAGLFLGLSAITRPTVLTFGVVLVAWMVCFRPMGRGWLNNIKAGALTVALCAFVILPVTIRNRVVGHEWVLIATNGGVNFYIGNNPNSNGYAAIVPGTRRTWDGGFEDTHLIANTESGRSLNESEVSDFWYHKAWLWIGENPGAWIRLLWLKFRLFFSPFEIPNNQPITQLAELSPVAALFVFGFPVVAPFAVAGFLAIRSQRGPWFLVIMSAVVSMATTILYFVNSRYRLVVIPQFLWLASAGAWMCIDWVRARRWPAVGAFSAIAALTAAFVLTNPPDRATHNASARGEACLVLGTTYYHLAIQRPPAGSRSHPGFYLGKAAEYLLQATELRPSDADARLCYGMVLRLLKRSGEADQQFRLATSRGGTADAHFYYGRVLEEDHRFGEAEEQYQLALDILPTMREARERLNALRARGAPGG